MATHAPNHLKKAKKTKNQTAKTGGIEIGDPHTRPLEKGTNNPQKTRRHRNQPDLKQTIIDFDKFKVNESKKEELENVIGNEFFEKDNEIIEKEVFESFMNDGDCIIFGNGPEWASLTYAPCCDNINCKEYSKYKDWIEKKCEKSLPLKIRLFLEVRVGSWLSSIQHSYDMCSKVQRFSFPISEKIIAAKIVAVSGCISKPIDAPDAEIFPIA